MIVPADDRVYSHHCRTRRVGNPDLSISVLARKFEICEDVLRARAICILVVEKLYPFVGDIQARHGVSDEVYLGSWRNLEEADNRGRSNLWVHLDHVWNDEALSAIREVLVQRDNMAQDFVAVDHCLRVVSCLLTLVVLCGNTPVGENTHRLRT